LIDLIKLEKLKEIRAVAAQITSKPLTPTDVLAKCVLLFIVALADQAIDEVEGR